MNINLTTTTNTNNKPISTTVSQFAAPPPGGLSTDEELSTDGSASSNQESDDPAQTGFQPENETSCETLAKYLAEDFDFSGFRDKTDQAVLESGLEITSDPRDGFTDLIDAMLLSSVEERLNMSGRKQLVPLTRSDFEAAGWVCTPTTMELFLSDQFRFSISDSGVCVYAPNRQLNVTEVRKLRAIVTQVFTISELVGDVETNTWYQVGATAAVVVGAGFAYKKWRQFLRKENRQPMEYLRLHVSQYLITAFMEDNPGISAATAKSYVDAAVDVVIVLAIITNSDGPLSPVAFAAVLFQHTRTRQFNRTTLLVSIFAWAASRVLHTMAKKQHLVCDAGQTTSNFTMKDIDALCEWLPSDMHDRVRATVSASEKFLLSRKPTTGNRVRDVLSIIMLARIVRDFVTWVTDVRSREADELLERATVWVNDHDANGERPLQCARTYALWHDMYLEASRARLLYTKEFTKHAGWQRLTSLIKGFDMAAAIGRTTRMPFGVRLYGPPKTGKTYLRNQVVNLFRLIEGVGENEPHVFALKDPNGQDTYMTGLNNHRVGLWDDVLHPGPSAHANRASIMNIVNDKPFVSEQAGIELKGQRLVDFTSAILVSNYDEVPVPHEQESAVMAVYRRFVHFHVKSKEVDGVFVVDIDEVEHYWENGGIRRRVTHNFTEVRTFLLRVDELYTAHQQNAGFAGEIHYNAATIHDLRRNLRGEAGDADDIQATSWSWLRNEAGGATQTIATTMHERAQVFKYKLGTKLAPAYERLCQFRDEIDLKTALTIMAKVFTVFLASAKIVDMLVSSDNSSDPCEVQPNPPVSGDSGRRGERHRAHAGRNNQKFRRAGLVGQASSHEIGAASVVIKYYAGGTHTKDVYALATQYGFVTVAHFVQAFELSHTQEIDTVQICSFNAAAQFDANTFFERAVIAESDDLMLIPYPRDMSKLPSLFKLKTTHFATDHEISPEVYVPITLVNMTNEFDVEGGVAEDHYARATYTTSVPSYNPDLRNTYQYPSPLKRGSCGTAVMVGGLVAGIHTCVDTDTKIGFGRFVSFQLIRAMHQQVAINSPTASYSKAAQQVCAEHGVDYTYRPAHVASSSKYVPSLVWRNQIQPLLSNDQLGKTTVPAPQGWYKNSEGLKTTPDAEALKILLGNQHLARRHYPIFYKMAKQLGTRDSQKYQTYSAVSLAEALGALHSDKVTTVDMTRSCGDNPYRCKTRYDCVDPGAMEKISAGIASLENSLAKANLTDAQLDAIAHELGVYADAVKDECIRKGKDPRIFFPAPLHVFVIMRKYLGHFFKQDALEPLKHRKGVGCSLKEHYTPMYQAWRDAYSVDIDAKRWDKLLPHSLIGAVGVYYATLMKHHGALPRDVQIVENLFRTFVNAPRAFGTVMLDLGLMASGLPGTTSINGVMLRILMSLVTYVHENDLDVFDNVVVSGNTYSFNGIENPEAIEAMLDLTEKAMFNGDDAKVITEHPDKWRKNTKALVARIREIFGVQFTGEKKDAPPTSSRATTTSFSSRTPHFTNLLNPETQRMEEKCLGLLKEQSLLSIGKHYRATNPEDIVAPSSSLSAMLETSMWIKACADNEDQDKERFWREFYEQHAIIAHKPNLSPERLLNEYYYTKKYDSIAWDEPMATGDFSCNQTGCVGDSGEATAAELEQSETRTPAVNMGAPKSRKKKNKGRSFNDSLSTLTPRQYDSAPKGLFSAPVSSFANLARHFDLPRVGDAISSLSYGLSAVGLNKPIKDEGKDVIGYVIDDHTKLDGAVSATSLTMGKNNVYLSMVNPDQTSVEALGDRMHWTTAFDLPLSSPTNTTIVDRMKIVGCPCTIEQDGSPSVGNFTFFLPPSGIASILSRGYTCDGIELVVFVPIGALANGRLLITASSSRTPVDLSFTNDLATRTVKHEFDLSKTSLYKCDVPWLALTPTQRVWPTDPNYHLFGPGNGTIDDAVMCFVSVTILQRVTTPGASTGSVSCRLGYRFKNLRLFGRNDDYVRRGIPGLKADAGGPDDTFDMEQPTATTYAPKIFDQRLVEGMPSVLHPVPTLHERRVLLQAATVMGTSYQNTFNLSDMLNVYVVNYLLSYKRAFKYDKLTFMVEVLGGPTCMGHVRVVAVPLAEAWACPTIRDISLGFYPHAFIPIAGSHMVSLPTPFIGPYPVTRCNATEPHEQVTWRDSFGYQLYVDAEQATDYDGIPVPYDLNIYAAFSNVEAGIPDTLVADAGDFGGNGPGDFESNMPATNDSYREIAAETTVNVGRPNVGPGLVGAVYGDEILSVNQLGSVLTPYGYDIPAVSGLEPFSNVSLDISHDLSDRFGHARNFAQFVSSFYALGRGPLLLSVSAQLNGSNDLPSLCCVANKPVSLLTAVPTTTALTFSQDTHLGNGAVVVNPRMSSVVNAELPPYYGTVWKIVPQASSLWPRTQVVQNDMPAATVDWQYPTASQTSYGAPFVGVAFGDGYSLAGLRHNAITLTGADYTAAESGLLRPVFTSTLR